MMSLLTSRAPLSPSLPPSRPAAPADRPADGDTTIDGQRYLIVDNINAAYNKPSLMDLKVRIIPPSSPPGGPMDPTSRTPGLPPARLQALAAPLLRGNPSSSPLPPSLFPRMERSESWAKASWASGLDGCVSCRCCRRLLLDCPHHPGRFPHLVRGGVEQRGVDDQAQVRGLLLLLLPLLLFLFLSITWKASTPPLDPPPPALPLLLPSPPASPSLNDPFLAEGAFLPPVRFLSSQGKG